MPTDNSDGYERLADIAVGVKKECTTVPTVLQEVVENYTELKNVLHDFYKENFKNVPQHIDRIANEISQSTKNMKEEALKVGEQLIDMSPVAVKAGVPVSKMFANSSVFLFIAAVSSFIGSYILAPLFNIIFLKFGAILIAAILIPLIGRHIFFDQKVRSMSEHKKRIVCATFVFEQSILIGFINQSDWLDTPFAVGTQIVASLVFPMVLAHTVQRDKILISLAGSCMLFHLTHGILLLDGLTAGFFVVALLYTLLALALTQYLIAHRSDSDFEGMHLSMQYVFAVSLVKMFSLMAFGSEE